MKGSRNQVKITCVMDCGLAQDCGISGAFATGIPILGHIICMTC